MELLKQAIILQNPENKTQTKKTFGRYGIMCTPETEITELALFELQTLQSEGESGQALKKLLKRYCGSTDAGHKLPVLEK